MEVMYSMDKKSLYHQHQYNHPKNPSFSSTLLDEIYRSIDGHDSPGDHHYRKQQDLKLVYTQGSTISAKKHGKKAAVAVAAGGGGGATVEDEEMAIRKRACLVEKWMQKEVSHHKISSRKSHNYNLPSLFHHQEDDPLFFSSASSSSESSNSSGLSSSSDTEFYATSIKSSKSCFTTFKKPKPVKTKQQSEFSMADYKASMSSDHKTEEENNLIKSQSRALKIYSNLKKVKYPISPGGRLTAFINNLFTNSKKHGSKEKNNANVPSIPERNSTKYSSNNIVSPPPPSTFSSACSTASSFSRSCLSKNSPNSRLAKMYNDGIKRTVRFYPVSVILDEDSRPCGHKHIHNVDDNNSDKPFVRPLTTLSSRKEAAAESKKIVNLKLCQDQKKENNQEEIQAEEMEDFDFNDDDDGASVCSSDLFEIDHLAIFGKDRFREELPVYETTHLDTNRAIASGLIR